MGYTLDKLKPKSEKFFSKVFKIDDETISQDADIELLRLDLQYKESSPDYNERLSTILQKVKSVKGKPLCVKVLRSDVINAWAWDNNNIRITTAMMDLLENDDELASIIGHEIGHIVHGHNKKRQINEKASSVFSTLAPGVGGNIIGHAMPLLYSRNHEIEADDYAFDFSIIIGYSPYGMANALKKIIEKENSSKVTLIKEFFATHPDSAYREERLRKKAIARDKALAGDFDIE